MLFIFAKFLGNKLGKQKLFDKIFDPTTKQGKAVENLSKASRFIPGGEGIQKIASKIGEKGDLVSKSVDKLREKALGGTDVRSRIMGEIDKIAGRDLPEVDEYKPAGKAAEWMNRIGAGLYAAGGGNPEDIYRNFRMKEETKAARHEKQKMEYQAALERRDADMISTLTGVDTRETQAAMQFAGEDATTARRLQETAATAAVRGVEMDNENQKFFINMQFDWEKSRQAHRDRITEADHQAQLSMEQIEKTAEIQQLTEYKSMSMNYGINPAGIMPTLEKAAAGDWENFDQVDNARMSLLGRLQKATTDQEVRVAKATALTQLMTSRIHARDKYTGEYLFNQATGDPIMVSPDAEAGMAMLFGDAEHGVDTMFGTFNPDAEQRGLEEFAQSQGFIDRPPMAGRPSAPDAAAMNMRSGFGSTQTDMAAEGADTGGREQMAQQADIWNEAAGYFQQGASMKQIVEGLKAGGAEPEILNMVMNQAMEYGFWDGQEDRAEIMSYLVPAGRGD
jgi:hypothetical protein